MKLFLDTAEVDQIRRYVPWGVVDGVTTNPSLVAKSGRVFEDVIREICSVVDGPVSAEVVATDTAGMVAEGGRLAALHRNVVVKVPLTEAGLVVRDAVTLIDRQEGGRTNLKAAGINLVSILKLDQIATYLMSAGHIPEDAYRRTMEYIEAHNGDA